MAVTPSEIYKLNVFDLRQLCSEDGLSSEGPVRLLVPRLLRHLTGATMESKQHTETAQASAQSDASLDPTHSGPFESNFVSCGRLY
jgi:hypothetical protein